MIRSLLSNNIGSTKRASCCSIFATAAVLTLAFPVGSFATAIQASSGTGPTVCEIGGTCPNAASVGIPPSPLNTSGTMDFTYEFTNHDQYLITGTYSASYATGPYIQITPIVTYTGNNGNTGASAAGADTLTLDMFQNYFDNTPGNWSGPPDACEHFGVTVPTGDGATADLSFGGQPIGLLTAAAGASSYQSLCTLLTIPPPAGTADVLQADYTLTFSFGANTAPNTSIVSFVPEPTSLSLYLFGCLGGGLLLFLNQRRLRRVENAR
jgi:hypothetical protein